MIKKCDSLNVTLCAGRHEIPQATDGAIFREIPERLITSPHMLEEAAFGRLWSIEHSLGVDSPDEEELYCSGLNPAVPVNIYVTGLTVALIAVLNVCRRERVPVTLYHYNRGTGTYFPQSVA